MSQNSAHVIVVGNEKGGSGKSTVSMHLIVSLLRGGLRVGTIDLDARQATLTRYIENRKTYAEKHGITLPMPEHYPLLPSGDQPRDEEILRGIIRDLQTRCDTIVIDTPGSDTYLSRAGHSYADTLITPLNDSFIDLDVLARVDPDTMQIKGYSHYAAMVFEVKKRRAVRDGGQIAWVVLRNRLSHLTARNKQDMERLVAETVGPPALCAYSGAGGTGDLPRTVPDRPDPAGPEQRRGAAGNEPVPRRRQTGAARPARRHRQGPCQADRRSLIRAGPCCSPSSSARP